MLIIFKSIHKYISKRIQIYIFPDLSKPPFRAVNFFFQEARMTGVSTAGKASDPPGNRLRGWKRKNTLKKIINLI
jgi:hypothetical protein